MFVGHTFCNCLIVDPCIAYLLPALRSSATWFERRRNSGDRPRLSSVNRPATRKSRNLPPSSFSHHAPVGIPRVHSHPPTAAICRVSNRFIAVPSLWKTPFAIRLQSTTSDLAPICLDPISKIEVSTGRRYKSEAWSRLWFTIIDLPSIYRLFSPWSRQWDLWKILP